MLLRRGAQHFLPLVGFTQQSSTSVFLFQSMGMKLERWGHLRQRGVKDGSRQPVLIQELEARGLVQQHGEVQRQVQ